MQSSDYINLNKFDEILELLRQNKEILRSNTAYCRKTLIKDLTKLLSFLAETETLSDEVRILGNMSIASFNAIMNQHDKMIYSLIDEKWLFEIMKEKYDKNYPVFMLEALKRTAKELKDNDDTDMQDAYIYALCLRTSYAIEELGVDSKQYIEEMLNRRKTILI